MLSPNFDDSTYCAEFFGQEKKSEFQISVFNKDQTGKNTNTNRFIFLQKIDISFQILAFYILMEANLKY